jgi:hypothetical protein
VIIKTPGGVETTWPSLFVQSLANLTGNPELDHVGPAIASEIALDITRYQEIRVFLQQPERRKRRASDSLGTVRLEWKRQQRSIAPQGERRSDGSVDGAANLGRHAPRGPESLPIDSFRGGSRQSRGR